MPTTPAGIRYPSSSDSINIPQDLLNLATDVDTYVQAQVGANVTPSSTTTLTNKTIGNTGLFFEGSTDDGFETLLTVVDPTADRTITLPNATGTVCLLDATQTLSNKTIDSPTFTGQVTGLELGAVQSLIFEGTTADAFETTLTAGDPVADLTITLPSSSGTLAIASDLSNLEISVIMSAF